jgi:hypothetical protein
VNERPRSNSSGASHNDRNADLFVVAVVVVLLLLHLLPPSTRSFDATLALLAVSAAEMLIPMSNNGRSNRPRTRK